MTDRKLISFMVVTLDGFYAGPDDEFELKRQPMNTFLVEVTVFHPYGGFRHVDVKRTGAR
jgi:hypothetical protein